MHLGRVQTALSSIRLCASTAIFSEDDVPENWAEYVELNDRLAVKWPEITQQKDPLPEADEFKDVESKRDLLDEGQTASHHWSSRNLLRIQVRSI